MTTLDYAVEVYNRGILLKNGLTPYDVASFWFLYNSKKGDFYEWYNKNLHLIKKIIDQPDIDTKLSKYINLPIDQFMDTLQVLFERIDLMQNPSKNISNPIKVDNRSLINVATGGADNKEKKSFLAGILFNLSLGSNLEDNYLPEPMSKNDNLPIEYKLEDISGTRKPHQRLIFIISLAGKNYILKITIPLPTFQKEIDIYKEFNVAMDNDAKIKDKIIRLYSSGKINKDEGYEADINGNKIKFNHNINSNVYQKISYIFDYYIQNGINITELIYSVQEFNKNYMTLHDALLNLKIINRCSLIEPVLQDLKYLNVTYGFSHLDLHINNVLVNVKNKKEPNIKFFDFDYATTNKNINIHAIDILLPKMIGGDFTIKDDNLNIPIATLNKIGFCYDFLRFMQGISIFWLKIFNCNNSVESLRIIYKNYKFTSLNDFKALGNNASFMSKNGDYDKIINILNQNNPQKAGNMYYEKYMKYKMKYLQLKINKD